MVAHSWVLLINLFHSRWSQTHGIQPFVNIWLQKNEAKVEVSKLQFFKQPLESCFETTVNHIHTNGKKQIFTAAMCFYDLVQHDFCLYSQFYTEADRHPVAISEEAQSLGHEFNISNMAPDKDGFQNSSFVKQISIVMDPTSIYFTVNASSRRPAWLLLLTVQVKQLVTMPNPSVN